MSFFKKLFGKNKKEEEFMSMIADIMTADKKPGRDLADHIVNNILAKGFQGSLKDIEDEIGSKYKNPTPVCVGLKERLIEYRDAEIIFTFTAQSNDTILVHKDYLDKFMDGLK